MGTTMKIAPIRLVPRHEHTSPSMPPLVGDHTRTASVGYLVGLTEFEYTERSTVVPAGLGLGLGLGLGIRAIPSPRNGTRSSADSLLGFAYPKVPAHLSLQCRPFAFTITGSARSVRYQPQVSIHTGLRRSVHHALLGLALSI